MRRSTPKPLRNKLDLTDRVQMRLVRKRLGLSDAGAGRYPRADRKLDFRDKQGSWPAPSQRFVQGGQCAFGGSHRVGHSQRADSNRNSRGGADVLTVLIGGRYGPKGHPDRRPIARGL